MSEPSKTRPPGREYPYYVSCQNTFMSGWGPAEGRINRLIFCCTSKSAANQVIRNLKTRSEMKNIRIATRQPVYPPHMYLAQWFTPFGSGAGWYEKIPPWLRGKCK